MGNVLPTSILLSPETNDLLSTRWSLINALKQNPCKSNSIMALLSMSSENYGSDALMNLKDGNGRTLLMLCIDRKLSEAVEYLLRYDKTVDVEARDNCYGWSAIMYAISTNQYDIVKGLVDMNCKIDEKDRNGMTCLMQASLQGFPDIAALLIDRGAGLDTTCKSGGLTALMLAARGGILYKKVMGEGSFHLLELLIKSGADTEITSNSGKKAIDYIRHNKLKEHYESIIEDTWHDTILHKAVHQNNIIELKKLLTSGAINVDVRGKGGWTALHVAAFCNRDEAMKILLEQGASILADDKGITPLHIACQRGKAHMISSLGKSENQNTVVL